MEPLNPTNVYILKLEDDCWYIGRTVDVQRRLEYHFKRNGSAWTKLHKPLSVEATFTNVSRFDEDKYTKEYMLRYGIDKVRGGTYAQPFLSKEYRQMIQRELWGAQDLCFLCGGKHFVKNCKISEKDPNEEQHKKINDCLQKFGNTLYNAVKSFLTPPQIYRTVL